MYRENRPGRISLASVVSAWSSGGPSDNDDGIKPHHHHHHHQDEARHHPDDHSSRRRSSTDEEEDARRPHTLMMGDRGRQSSTCSDRSCEGMSPGETRDLWRCMLELQLRYGCYTSARIDMALEAGGDGADLMPNRFIIDTLNESVLDLLPDEGRELLNRHLAPPSAGAPKQRWWKKKR